MKSLKIFDEYNLRARLLPALIIILPIIFSVIIWFPTIVSIGGMLSTSIISYGISALLANALRAKGKAKESEVYEAIGGMPTTLLLRHSDQTLDSLTKERYRNCLEKHINNITMPSVEEEAVAIGNADLVYKSAVSWLREKTRDTKKFRLVFEENMNYGFIRNLWAGKLYGLTISIIALICNLWGIYVQNEINLQLMPMDKILSVLIALLFVAIWIFFITKRHVIRSAYTYGSTLLATCEKIESSQNVSSKKKAGK